MSKNGAYTSITSVGGYGIIKSTADAYTVGTGENDIEHYGMKTAGMTSCFTAILVGNRSLFLYVPNRE
jgi:hypothetical protein